METFWKKNREQLKPYTVTVSDEKPPASEENPIASDDEVTVSDEKHGNHSPFENKSTAAADENQDVAAENNFIVNHWHGLPNEVLEII